LDICNELLALQERKVNPLNKSKAASHNLLQIAISLMMIMSCLTNASALFVLKFGNNEAQSSVIFAGPGTDNSTTLMLPANGTVTGAKLSVRGQGTNITVDVGEDGTTDWAYQSKGYGRLAKQTMFSDGSVSWPVKLGQGANSSRTLLLPAGAQVSGATLYMAPKGSLNLSFETDRYFTVKDGQNTVDLGFKDKAFLAPELKDLDMDGMAELLVGVSPYGSPGAGSLAYYDLKGLNANPRYEFNNTFSGITITDANPHPVLVDIDNDGDLDLVLGGSDGTLKFYKHDGSVQVPVWTQNTTLFSGIDVGTYSAPAFVDLNGDLKLDLVIGNEVGDLTFYNNTGSMGSPAFTLVPGFFSSIHVAGFATPTFGDLNVDTIPDLVLGNGTGGLQFYQNNGTKTSALFMLNTTFFKGVTTFYTRSSPILHDLDGDGDLDLLAGFANPRLTFWKNLRGDGMPDPWGLYNIFTFGNLTLHSQSSAIEMADLNGDGRDDLIEVTNDSRFFGLDQKVSGGVSSFQPNTSTFLGLQDPVGGADPAFADLDGDGDLDMLCGNVNGDLTYFKNTGTKKAPIWQKISNWAPVTGIDVGTDSAPALADLNGDGLADLVLGTDAGKLKYYSNLGTALGPIFTLNATLFGSVDYGANSKAVPQFSDLDGDGDLDLIVSYATGGGYSTVPDYYENVGTPKVPSFVIHHNILGNTGYIIQRPHLGFTDLDNDGDKELLMGGDPAQQLYYLKGHTYININVSVNSASSVVNLEMKAKAYNIDITTILNKALKTATNSTDAYGNDIAALKLDLKALKGFNAVFTIGVDYSYTVQVLGLVDVLNGYVLGHKAQADAAGMIKVPISIHSMSDGSVTLSDLNLTVDQPPRIVRPLSGFFLGEDSLKNTTVDLYQLFDDDFTSDSGLSLSLDTLPCPAKASLYQDRYIAVDSKTSVASHDWNGPVPVRANVTDALGHTTSTGWFNITVRPVNDPPVLHSVPPTFAIVGATYLYQLNATDIDHDQLSYDQSLYPIGMTTNTSSGLVSWVPSDTDVGPNDVMLLITDGTVTIAQNFTITVGPRPVVNSPPMITSTPVLVAYVGQLYQYKVLALDDDGDAVHFLIPGGKGPSGMSLDPISGLLSWVPSMSQVGSHNVTVLVSDGTGNATQNFSIEVFLIDLPPKLTSSPLTEAKVSVPYSYKVMATDPDNQVLNFTLLQAPQGMTIEKATGQISWTPLSNQVGTVQVTVEVSDGRNKVEQTFNIMVSFVQPTVSLTSPKNNQTVKGEFTLKGQASLSVGSIAKIQVKVDNKDWKDAKGTTGWVYSLDTKKLSNGKHTLTVRALSSTNTSSELKSVTVTVHNQDQGLGSSLMVAVLAGVLILVIVILVLLFFVMRSKQGFKTGKSRRSKTKAQRETEEGIPTDEEMEADLEEMDREEEVVPSDEEVEGDLAELDKAERKLKGKEEE
jgi:hypothetical protein